MNWALSARARLDIRIILSASGDKFGQRAQRRYRLLLEQAIADVAANPDRAGVQTIGGRQLRFYHTRHARPRTPAQERVRRPRHLVVFEVRGERLEILRVLHDAMDLPGRLSEL
jgi:toxin ParE1/3/4